MQQNVKVLIVDDDAAMRDMLVVSLDAEGFRTLQAGDAPSAEEMLRAADIDVVVTDVRMGAGPSGLDLAARMGPLYPDVPTIVVTAFGDLEMAISAIRAGAYDFVPKPFRVDELIVRVRRAAEWRSLRAEVRRLREDRAGGVPFESMLGRSPAMERVFSLIDRVADSDASVLISGETGTGKELVARALHARSRQNGPFVAINCAAMPEALLESELFGHARGAFTDARNAHNGLFVQAHGGTILLDEIAEMPLALQAKMLRALQEKAVRPIGGDREVPFDARIVSATHRDIEARIGEGLFREDLYYRLNVLEIRVPPLRSRGADILLLAHDFVERFAARTERPIRGIDPACAKCLLEYSWPGNVRELANVIERAVVLAQHDAITVSDLPDKLSRVDRADVITASSDPDELVTLEEIERRYVLKVLSACGGHRGRASEVLAIDRKTLYSKLKQYARES
jgi:two-component system response regulator HydG